eukprot:TRINITY_DN4818_c0_g1_i6.p1 TRINITY_DN4818_c0_g1~~TRINITY_DN4818_c0_g1_i6.p1  ORF type:complete len:229 (-),score=44.56 TRINITY_DN4818_c0_g1_i6:313-903(-)
MAGALAGDLVGMFHQHLSDKHAIALTPGTAGLHGAMFAETLFTFVLVFVVLAVATARDANSSFSFGLAIASCVTAGGVAAGSLSGGVLNPAVALMISSANFATGGEGTMDAFLKWAGAEMLGATVAAAVFFMTWRSEYKAKPEEGEAAMSAELLPQEDPAETGDAASMPTLLNSQGPDLGKAAADGATAVDATAAS